MRHDSFGHTILLYGHSGSGNRGCEAIVRSTARIHLDTLGSETEIGVASIRPHEDDQAGIRASRMVIAHPDTTWFIQFVKVSTKSHLAESIHSSDDRSRPVGRCLPVDRRRQLLLWQTILALRNQSLTKADRMQKRSFGAARSTLSLLMTTCCQTLPSSI